MFLEDAIEEKKAELAGKSEEERKKREAGFVKIRALDPMDGNKMKSMWVKKDELTERFEAEEAQKTSLEDRQAEVDRKARMLEMLKKEKELEERQAELDKLEKELTKGSKKKDKDE